MNRVTLSAPRPMSDTPITMTDIDTYREMLGTLTNDAINEAMGQHWMDELDITVREDDGGIRIHLPESLSEMQGYDLENAIRSTLDDVWQCWQEQLPERVPAPGDEDYEVDAEVMEIRTGEYGVEGSVDADVRLILPDREDIEVEVTLVPDPINGGWVAYGPSTDYWIDPKAHSAIVSLGHEDLSRAIYSLLEGAAAEAIEAAVKAGTVEPYTSTEAEQE